MNTVPTTSFENEQALALLSELLDSPDATTLLANTLRCALMQSAIPETRLRAIAAAEIVAAGMRLGVPWLPDEVGELLSLFLVTVDPPLVELALEAVRSVRGQLNGTDSSAPLHATGGADNLTVGASPDPVGDLGTSGDTLESLQRRLERAAVVGSGQVAPRT